MTDPVGSPDPSVLDVIAEAVRRADEAREDAHEARVLLQVAYVDRQEADLALERERQRRAPERDLIRTLWAGLNEAQRDAFQGNLSDLHRETLFALLGITVWADIKAAKGRSRSFEETLTDPEFQTSLDSDLLPHLLNFGPPASIEVVPCRCAAVHVGRCGPAATGGYQQEENERGGDPMRPVRTRSPPLVPGAAPALRRWDASVRQVFPRRRCDGRVWSVHPVSIWDDDTSDHDWVQQHPHSICCAVCNRWPNHHHREAATMRTHTLKTDQPYFQAVWDGAKPFEIRRNDRGYQPGDLVHLREGWTAEDGTYQYTGRQLTRAVTYVLRDGERFGLDPDFVVLGLDQSNVVAGS